MKPLCLLVIILICGEITASFGLGSQGTAVISGNNRLALLGTLIIWTLPTVLGSEKAKPKPEVKAATIKPKVKKGSASRKPNPRDRERAQTIKLSLGKGEGAMKDIILTLEDDNAESPTSSGSGSGSQVIDIGLDPMTCFPKALCGVSSEVAQISKRKKNVLITDYILLMKAIARNPKAVNEILSTKDKDERPQKDISSSKKPSKDTDDSDEEQDDKNDDDDSDEDDDEDEEEDDEPEERQTPIIIKESKLKKYEKVNPKNEAEFDKYSLMEKAHIDTLFKDAVDKESTGEKWWQFGSSSNKPKPSWWRSLPVPQLEDAPKGQKGQRGKKGQKGKRGKRGRKGQRSKRPSYIQEEPLSRPPPNLSGFDYGPTGAYLRSGEDFVKPVPTFGYGFDGPSSPENDDGPPPQYFRTDGFGSGPQPPPRPDDFGQFSAEPNYNQGGGGLTRFVSNLFGFGSGGGPGMFGSDSFYDGMARDLSPLTGETPATLGILQTKEILETAMELGKQFDKPSKCNEIFNACKFEYQELLYMIDDLRRGLRTVRDDDKEAEKPVTRKSPSNSKGKKTNAKTSLLKGTTRAPSKAKASNKKPSQTVRRKKTKKRTRLPVTKQDDQYVYQANGQHGSRPHRPSYGQQDRPSYGQQGPQQGKPGFSLSNVFSWLSKPY